MWDNRLNSIDSRIEDITIQSKAVGSTIREGWDSASKAVQVDHFVAVVELQDITYAFNRFQVLIMSRVKVM